MSTDGDTGSITEEKRHRNRPPGRKMICNTPCRIILFIVNFLTSCAGLLVLAVGAILAWGKSIAHYILDNYLRKFLESLSPTSEAGATTDIINRLVASSAPLGYILFGLGCAIFLASLLGYFGACSNSRTVYYVYQIILALMAAIIVTAVITYYFKKEAASGIVENFFAESVKKYKSLAENDIHSLIVGFISPALNCCGIQNASDFVNMSPWDQYHSHNFTDLEYPLVCCKMDSSFRIVDTSCPTVFTEKNSNVHHGCREPLRNKFFKYMDYVVIVLIAGLGLLLLLIVLTSFIACIDFD